MQFRNDIQGLRAVAFLLVYFFHLNPSWMPGGFVGVDMFFVISGYLITSILLKQKGKGTFSFLTFYEKRIKRIIPAHFIMLILVLISSYFIFLSSDFFPLRSTTLRSALFVSNMLFANGQSYFGVGLIDNPLLHTWSLAIEMQFYLILPIVLIYFSNRLLPWIVGFLIILLTAYSSYEIVINYATSSMYFSLLARIPEFLIGSLLSILFTKRQLISGKNSVVISIVGLLSIFGSAIFFNEEIIFPGLTALIPTIGTSLLLISNKNIFSNLLSKKPVVHIGELSYSLYLWHWPVMALMRYPKSRFIGYDFSVLEIVFISIVTYALAWLSYTFIENEFRTTDNKKFVYVFSPIVVTLVGLAFVLPVLSSNNSLPTEYTKASFGLMSHGNNNVETLGDTTSLYDKIFLMGDSHALVIKPFLDHLGKEHRFAFKTITTDTYVPIAGIDREEVPKVGTKFYDLSRSLIDPVMQEVAKSDIIIINSIGFERLPSMESALNSFAKNLRPDQNLIVLNSFPIVDRNPVRVNKSVSKNTGYNFQIIDKSKNKQILERVANQYPNVYYYDLSKSKVFNSPPFYNDKIIYYDDQHINIFGAIEMAQDLDSDFMNLLRHLMTRRIKSAINNYQ